MVWRVEVSFLIVLLILGCAAPGKVPKLGSIDCFKCYSINGSERDCEDEFGPQNKTGHLIARACRVGVLSFAAHYCVKIKGVKENGQRIVIRTCAMDDWGTQCGDLRIEQEGKMEAITGCLATCDFDGCNTASHWSSRYHLMTSLGVSLSVLFRYFTSEQHLLT